MNVEMLTHAMSAIGDDLIAAADSDRVRRRFLSRRAKRRKATMIAALAAAVCVILATALFAAGHMSGGNGTGPIDENYGNEASKPDASGETSDWNGLKVTARLYSKLMHSVPEAGVSGSPEASYDPMQLHIIIIPQSAKARDGAKAAFTASGIGYGEKGGIAVSLTPTQLAALDGDWVDECIFDLAE